MTRNLLYRSLLVLGATLAALLYLVPTVVRSLPSWWRSFLPDQAIRLGLDLQGGMHLVLEVQTEKALEFSVDRSAEDLKRELQSARVAVGGVSRDGSRAIVIDLAEGGKAEDVAGVVKDRFPTLQRVTADVPAGRLRFVVTAKEIERIQEFAVEQSLETVRNRIDQLGLSEPLIQRSGSDSILVQLPGETDPDRAKSIIGKTAILEFKLLAENKSVESALGGEDPCRLRDPERGQSLARATARAGAGSEVLCGMETEPLSGRSRPIAHLLEKKTLMTGEVIADARPRPDSNVPGNYLVELSFNARGANLFEDLTAKNVGRRLAIVLDNTVYSAPRIQERIAGGRAVITGSFDIRDARDLTIVLRAGALPAPVTIAEERTVGPSLGRDSIRQGMLSFAVGSVLVILFMAVYYRGAGVLADAALLINVLYMLAGLAAFGATLTLPGIAGIVLTMGIAVDANVLINERIREETRLGKTVRAAVDAGYERAFPAIIDTHVTTFLSGLILFQFGSGPVKGFAVTLCIGLVTTIFTAYFCTRVWHDIRVQVHKIRAVSI
ncbi:MAG: protein translocase subunit SecD [Deltaproteobacteria bacterium]|nr:protein translocase subunit SecD [Deltaproteobacteria bacterium]